MNMNARIKIWNDINYLKSPTPNSLLLPTERQSLDLAIRDVSAASCLTNPSTAFELVSHLIKVVSERIKELNQVKMNRTKLGLNYGR
jgi:hypothetical protein